MGTTVHGNLNLHSDLNVSYHARQRMSGRGLSPDAISRVINFGRIAYVRGATIYAVGSKEVERFEADGIDLSDVEGVQAVCSGNVLVTVYRNRNFRGLRPSRRRVRRFW